MSPDSGAGVGVVAQDAVYAGLAALKAAAPLDLCAYLHIAAGEGPQLFLGTPDLSSIEPAEAFSLFSSLRDALEVQHAAERPIELGGYRAFAVSSAGGRSRGLHVFGRKAEPIPDEDRRRLLGLASGFARLVHDLQVLAAPKPTPGAAPARVSVEMGEGSARAEVAVPLGDEIRTGHGEAPAATRAVALAVVDAVDAGLKLAELTEGDVGGERAVLVLVRDGGGRSSLGAVLIDEGGGAVAAAAQATLEAAARGIAHR